MQALVEKDITFRAKKQSTVFTLVNRLVRLQVARATLAVVAHQVLGVVHHGHRFREASLGERFERKQVVVRTGQVRRGGERQPAGPTLDGYLAVLARTLGTKIARFQVCRLRVLRRRRVAAAERRRLEQLGVRHVREAHLDEGRLECCRSCRRIHLITVTKQILRFNPDLLQPSLMATKMKNMSAYL